MSSKPKVIFKNVSKKYTLQEKKSDKLLGLLFSKSSNKSFYALRNISFTVDEGSTIGVIGINGSGKSTLSNLLAQIVPPTSGEIEINGETSLIAIAVGLNVNLTGLENIKLKCLMQGLSVDEIKKITPLIIEFAELGDFINQPVKSYSSGMKSRLGFAIEVHTNPDIMIIDEALSVGDKTFYDKCINKMNEFKKEGKTIFFISHSISQVKSFCDKVMWIHHGELIEFGNTDQVLNNYNEFIKYFNGLSEQEKKTYKKDKLEAQMLLESASALSTSRKKRNVKKRRSNYKILLELFLIFILFTMSTFLMLFNNVDVGAKGAELTHPEKKVKIENINKSGINKDEKQVETNVDKTGYVINQNETVYQSVNLKKDLFTLNFSDEVLVNKQIGNVFEIKVNNQIGYVNQENIYIPSAPLVQQDFNILKILPAFPRQFISSYEYYLAFLNSEQKNIEKMLRGKTGETSDSLGNKYIIFDKVKYRLTSNQLADRLIINDFYPRNEDINFLNEKATFKSKDNKNICILTKTNEFIFNLNENIVTVTAGTQPIR